MPGKKINMNTVNTRNTQKIYKEAKNLFSSFNVIKLRWTKKFPKGAKSFRELKVEISKPV